MIKYFYLVIAFTATAISCDNRANNDGEDTMIDTAVNQNGLPLDNIHRSRGKDTTKNEDGSAKEGVPLDNLDRDKSAD
ncbi:hypothetical protein ACR78H_17965 [Sphingobacterium siyangense]|uniref:hypothetical protein n=1 Tax=Sphingobacterium siyangense TaxID=459529 RepID=UPI003DA5416B